MSLNWKEINLILSELDLEGAQIQKAFQPNYEALALVVYKKGVARTLLFVLTSGGCRFHETFRAVPKADKPLRFGEFCKSRLVNGWIEEASQIGEDRIVRLVVKRGDFRYRFYARLWSGAANVIVTGEDGVILDAMRRLPKRGEVTGSHYAPQTIPSHQAGAPHAGTGKVYMVREYSAAQAGEAHSAGSVYPAGAFNAAIDAEYAEHGKELSLDALHEKAEKVYGARIVRIAASLEKLREKEAAFAKADELRGKGEAVMAGLGEGNVKADIALAETYFEKYKKAKSGIVRVREEIAEGEHVLAGTEAKLRELLAETNPLRLAKLLKTESGSSKQGQGGDKKRPGLSFMRGKWLFIVGRDAKENDELLRRHVKGADFWLHVRDIPGGYVFVKAQRGKSIPLDILLDAGNLAVFYSKARNNGKADLFYTQVKYLRRTKTRGLVIPTQEKNLSITLDKKRLKVLEGCRI
ncbi:MAG: NFACT RNA binding domain-containing protein [Spirochaetaceae bacterium]|jgi:predicted ribosome quality control (RQC) complex YloA/Tae2 family protein|nr:NFACT RNA binding domain-containing protein [Spirochaetaceae bacterium]